jgi:hypothetical protein
MSTVGNWQGAGIVKDSSLVLYIDPGSPNSYYNKTATTIKDISGNNLTGSFTNGAAYSSSNGGNIALDGGDDYVTFGDVAALNFTTPFSIGCWFKANTTQPSPDSGIIGNIAASPYSGYMLWYNGNTVDFYFNSGVRANSTTTIATNTWYHVMGVWTGTAAQVYLNGALNVSAAYAIAPSNGGPVFTIGQYQSGRMFAGNVTLCTAYSRALDATEVLQNYNASRARFGL